MTGTAEPIESIEEDAYLDSVRRTWLAPDLSLTRLPTISTSEFRALMRMLTPASLSWKYTTEDLRARQCLFESRICYLAGTKGIRVMTD